MRAATDTEIEIKKSGDISVATVTKQREMEIDGSFAFGLEVVEIGVNDRGKKVTSCVVTEIDVSDIKSKRNRRPKGNNQKILLKAMKNLGASGKLENNRLLDLPMTCKGIEYEKLYELIADNLPCDAKHRKTRFNEAMGSLVGDEFMGMEKGFVWLVP